MAAIFDDDHATTATEITRGGYHVDDSTDRKVGSTKQSVFDTSEDRVNREPTVASSDPAVAGEGDAGGSIDSFPTLGRQSSPPSRLETTSPWELDSETVRKLDAIVRETAPAPSHASTDGLAGWFRGPGGFIDVQSDRAPLHFGGLSAEVVDIVLEATLGRHRSFELIASSRSSITCDAEQDAVLAAINGEWSEKAGPLDAASNSRLSTLAYPGAAIVAGALAVISRKNQSWIAMRQRRSSR